METWRCWGLGGSNRREEAGAREEPRQPRGVRGLRARLRLLLDVPVYCLRRDIHIPEEGFIAIIRQTISRRQQD